MIIFEDEYWDHDFTTLEKSVISFILYRNNNLIITIGFFATKMSCEVKDLKKALKNLKWWGMISIEKDTSEKKYSTIRIYKVIRRS